MSEDPTVLEEIQALDAQHRRVVEAKPDNIEEFPEDSDDADPDDIPQELIELSIALDTGDAASTAKAAEELRALGGQQ